MSTERDKILTTIPQTLNEYAIKEQIGESAYGAVFKAEHYFTDEIVAIKVTSKESLKQSITELSLVNNEVTILKLLNHKNILKLYEIIESSTHIFMVTELCEGVELSEYILKKGKLSEEEAVVIFSQVVDAMIYLHSMNICHRDIKPQNIMYEPSKKKVKIIDFDYSCYYMSKDIYLTDDLGTPSFACPEMHQGLHYKPELADVYSCGVLLYVLVTGYLPFSKEDEEENEKLIVNGEYEMPKDISKECQVLIAKMMALNSNARWSFNEVINCDWFKKSKFKPPEIVGGLNFFEVKFPVDDDLLKIMKTMGYEPEIIKKELEENRYSQGTSIYRQLVNKLSRNDIKTVSDPNSERFHEYISDSTNYYDEKTKEKNIEKLMKYEEERRAKVKKMQDDYVNQQEKALKKLENMAKDYNKMKEEELKREKKKGESEEKRENKKTENKENVAQNSENNKKDIKDIRKSNETSKEASENKLEITKSSEEPQMSLQNSQLKDKENSSKSTEKSDKSIQNPSTPRKNLPENSEKSAETPKDSQENQIKDIKNNTYSLEAQITPRKEEKEKKVTDEEQIGEKKEKISVGGIVISSGIAKSLYKKVNEKDEDGKLVDAIKTVKMIRRMTLSNHDLQQDSILKQNNPNRRRGALEGSNIDQIKEYIANLLKEGELKEVGEESGSGSESENDGERKERMVKVSEFNGGKKVTECDEINMGEKVENNVGKEEGKDIRDSKESNGCEGEIKGKGLEIKEENNKVNEGMNKEGVESKDNQIISNEMKDVETKEEIREVNKNIIKDIKKEEINLEIGNDINESKSENKENNIPKETGDSHKKSKEQILTKDEQEETDQSKEANNKVLISQTSEIPKEPQLKESSTDEFIKGNLPEIAEASSKNENSKPQIMSEFSTNNFKEIHIESELSNLEKEMMNLENESESVSKKREGGGKESGDKEKEDQVIRKGGVRKKEGEVNEAEGKKEVRGAVNMKKSIKFNIDTKEINDYKSSKKENILSQYLNNEAERNKEKKEWEEKKERKEIKGSNRPRTSFDNNIKEIQNQNDLYAKRVKGVKANVVKMKNVSNKKGKFNEVNSLYKNNYANRSMDLNSIKYTDTQDQVSRNKNSSMSQLTNASFKTNITQKKKSKKLKNNKTVQMLKLSDKALNSYKAKTNNKTVRGEKTKLNILYITNYYNYNNKVINLKNNNMSNISNVSSLTNMTPIKIIDDICREENKGNTNQNYRERKSDKYTKYINNSIKDDNCINDIDYNELLIHNIEPKEDKVFKREKTKTTDANNNKSYLNLNVKKDRGKMSAKSSKAKMKSMGFSQSLVKNSSAGNLSSKVTSFNSKKNRSKNKLGGKNYPEPPGDLNDVGGKKEIVYTQFISNKFNYNNSYINGDKNNNKVNDAMHQNKKANLIRFSVWKGKNTSNLFGFSPSKSKERINETLNENEKKGNYCGNEEEYVSNNEDESEKYKENSVINNKNSREDISVSHLKGNSCLSNKSKGKNTEKIGYKYEKSLKPKTFHKTSSASKMKTLSQERELSAQKSKEKLRILSVANKVQTGRSKKKTKKCLESKQKTKARLVPLKNYNAKKENLGGKTTAKYMNYRNKTIENEKSNNDNSGYYEDIDYSNIKSRFMNYDNYNNKISPFKDSQAFDLSCISYGNYSKIIEKLKKNFKKYKINHVEKEENYFKCRKNLYSFDIKVVEIGKNVYYFLFRIKDSGGYSLNNIKNDYLIKKLISG